MPNALTPMQRVRGVITKRRVVVLANVAFAGFFAVVATQMSGTLLAALRAAGWHWAQLGAHDRRLVDSILFSAFLAGGGLREAWKRRSPRDADFDDEED